MDADLLVKQTLSADDLEQIEQAFRAAGFRPTAYRAPARRGPEEFSWLVIAALPLSSFLTTLGTKLAEDSYRELRQLARRVLQRESTPSPSTLVLEDRDTGTQVLLESDLPDDAYRTLVKIGLIDRSGGRLRYDRDRARWALLD